MIGSEYRPRGPDIGLPSCYYHFVATVFILSPLDQSKIQMPSWSSSVAVPSYAARKGSPGVKAGKVISDSATLTRKGFVTVRFLSRRRIKIFKMSRDLSSTYNYKENSDLSGLKLFTALLSIVN